MKRGGRPLEYPEAARAVKAARKANPRGDWKTLRDWLEKRAPSSHRNAWKRYARDNSDDVIRKFIQYHGPESDASTTDESSNRTADLTRVDPPRWRKRCRLLREEIFLPLQEAIAGGISSAKDEVRQHSQLRAHFDLGTLPDQILWPEAWKHLQKDLSAGGVPPKSPHSRSSIKKIERIVRQWNERVENEFRAIEVLAKEALGAQFALSDTYSTSSEIVDHVFWPYIPPLLWHLWETQTFPPRDEKVKADLSQWTPEKLDSFLVVGWTGVTHVPRFDLRESAPREPSRWVASCGGSTVAFPSSQERALELRALLARLASDPKVREQLLRLESDRESVGEKILSLKPLATALHFVCESIRVGTYATVCASCPRAEPGRSVH